MKTFIAALLAGTFAFSASAFADLTSHLSVEVTPQRGGAWVFVEKNGVPQANIDVSVPSQKSAYNTKSDGRVFVYTNREPSHTLAINISEQGGESLTVRRLIPSSR
ncbi:hypothetical protein [Photobacterium galatheae]|uniref:Uncharacterized protein n=1 Tax=Photobacterium galatheae TaxID=1654360 RepID=A0A066RUZ4_9GAMM|nr:hypothetical protein [Photobacterium galatheae]KDM91173.1 hypothetical protein EA58_13565 [Photobacterium galatheae]MCM0150105.1 hypothetical protein [Photobacterium galatheae]